MTDELKEEVFDDLEIYEDTEKYIEERNGKFCIISHRTGKNLGCSDTKEEAQARLDRMKRFREKQLEVKFASMDEEKRIVYGIVLEPDEVDAHEDTVNAEEIEKAAHRYALNPVIGDSHRTRAKAMPVETFIYNPEVVKEVKPGSWVMAVKVDDEEMWEGVKEGLYTGFSIGALVRRTLVEDADDEECQEEEE